MLLFETEGSVFYQKRFSISGSPDGVFPPLTLNLLHFQQLERLPQLYPSWGYDLKAFVLIFLNKPIHIASKKKKKVDMLRIGILPFEETRECAKYSSVFLGKNNQMQSPLLPHRAITYNNKRILMISDHDGSLWVYWLPFHRALRKFFCSSIYTQRQSCTLRRRSGAERKEGRKKRPSAP